MKFSRLANNSDFEKCIIHIDHSREMSDDIKWLIEQGNMHKAVKHLRDSTGMGAITAKGFCEEYNNFIQAKKDFESGKMVFVQY